MKKLSLVIIMGMVMVATGVFGYTVGTYQSTKEYNAQLESFKNDYVETVNQYESILDTYKTKVNRYETERDELGEQLTNWFNDKEFNVKWTYEGTTYTYEYERDGLFGNETKIVTY